jgi:two-component system sensor histidine kinase AlgZ
MDAARRTSEVLPREMLWALAVVPPFLGVLFWGQEAMSTVGQMFEALIAIWLYTLGLGFALHMTFVWLAPKLEQGRFVLPLRVVVYAIVVAALVAVVTLVTTPILGTIAISANIHPLSIGVRAFVICCFYLVFGTTLARFRARAVGEALRADAQERVALEARLAALQARTNPHFLFNALNAVASLISVDAARAEHTLERLASLFRYSLDSADRRTVQLRDEMEAVRDYLDIETTRFGERLKTHVDVDTYAAAASLPPMTIQPLVENAILHGLGRGTKPGNVWVSAKQGGEVVVVTVEDDGVGPGGSPRKGTGTALAGIRGRLALAFGDKASLVTGARDGGGFRAVLRLPLEQR